MILSFSAMGNEAQGSHTYHPACWRWLQKRAGLGIPYQWEACFSGGCCWTLLGVHSDSTISCLWNSGRFLRGGSTGCSRLRAQTLELKVSSAIRSFCDLGQVPSPLCMAVSTAVKHDNNSSDRTDLSCGLNVIIHVEHFAQCLAQGPIPSVSAAFGFGPRGLPPHLLPSPSPSPRLTQPPVCG